MNVDCYDRPVFSLPSILSDSAIACVQTAILCLLYVIIRLNSAFDYQH